MTQPNASINQNKPLVERKKSKMITDNEDFSRAWEDEGDGDSAGPVATSEGGSQDSHSRTILHFDIDCFYAQVEMLRDPSLRDKPLGIQQKNIVVTCNYPARAKGVGKCAYVRDAMQVGQIRFHESFALL